MKRKLTLILLLLFTASITHAAPDAGQITSQIINKAISTTEGYINTQANEIANSFGKGRTSISIKGIESQEPSYSIDTIQPLSEFNSDIKELTFVQGSVASGENEGDRRNTINLGLGQRYLVEDERAITGINLFVDYESSSKHKRASLGVEYERSNFSVSANKYYPISDKKVIGDYTEEALPGHDINLSGQMPYAPWATIKGTHYYWDQATGDNISGNILGVKIELSPSTSIEFGQEDSNTSNKQSYAELSIKLPLDDNEKMTNFALDDAPFRAQAMMDLTRLTTFERNNKIKIEKLLNNIAPVFTSNATATVVENQTTAITLVATDEQVITYSISNADSALFVVNSATGIVSFVTAPDFESPSDSDTNNTYAFTATATDAKGLSTTQSVVVTVINTDDTAPVFTSSASANAAENQTAATTLVATDATTVTYSISGTDASFFNINSGSGVVTFKTAPDFETKTSYSFTATATDTASNATTQAVVITVTNFVSEFVSETITFENSAGTTLTYMTVESTYEVNDIKRVWLDRNLGAAAVCTSSVHSACYGDLYQWGRNDGGHESRGVTTTTTTPADVFSAGTIFIKGSTDWTLDDPATDVNGELRTKAWADNDDALLGGNDICPSGFSVPTEAEIKVDTIDAGVSNSGAAFSSFLKIPLAGYRDGGNGSLYEVGTGGHLWSRSADGSNGRSLAVSTGSGLYSDSRASGFSVRCIKD
jgi:hypothetical protein